MSGSERAGDRRSERRGEREPVGDDSGMAVAIALRDRVAPYDLEAERATIGAILLDPQVADDVAMVINRDDFYDSSNAIIFQAIDDLRSSGRGAVDPITLANALRDGQLLEGCGGVAYLQRLFCEVPTSAHAAYYAAIVREKSLLRALLRAASLTVDDVYKSGEPAAASVAAAEQRIFAIAERGVATDETVRNVGQVLDDALAKIESRVSGELVGCPTGYCDVDDLLGGLRPGELTIVGGRPGHGKTAFGMMAAVNAAKAGKRVLYISLEMSSIELAERMLAAEARIDLYRLRRSMIGCDQRAELVESSARLAGLPLFFDDASSRTMLQIGSVARRQARRTGLDAIFVDYVQLIHPDSTREPRQEQVAKISRRCKTLARELGVAVIIMAQVNRESASACKAPRLSELRESGSLEQDADVVLFVFRPADYDPTKRNLDVPGEEAELHVAKHRNGPTGVVKLNWFRSFCCFANYAPEPTPFMQTYGEGDSPYSFGVPSGGAVASEGSSELGGGATILPGEQAPRSRARDMF